MKHTDDIDQSDCDRVDRILSTFDTTKTNEWMALMSGTCPECNNDFLKYYISQQFCDKACHNKYHNKRNALARKLGRQQL